MSSLRVITAVSSLLLAATPAWAASDYLLQLGGVQGDSAGPQTIEVESFSWGTSHAATAATGGGTGAGKVNVQDLSVAAVQAPRDRPSGMATGKRSAVVADADGDGRADTAAAAPKVGDVATFTVAIRESPTRASTGKVGPCTGGTHFPQAVIVARGQRYELSDVVVTSCTVADGLARKEFKGHVTLLK